MGAAISTSPRRRNLSKARRHCPLSRRLTASAAAAEGMSGVNAAMAYGTDGAIAALGLVALDDDKGAEIVYAPAPVVRAAVVKEYPQMPALLDPVFKGLGLTTLQQLNAKIAVDGEQPEAVAATYLKSRHLLP